MKKDVYVYMVFFLNLLFYRFYQKGQWVLLNRRRKLFTLISCFSKFVLVRFYKKGQWVYFWILDKLYMYNVRRIHKLLLIVKPKY